MKLDASNETGYGYGDGEGEEPSIVKSDGKHCIETAQVLRGSNAKGRKRLKWRRRLRTSTTAEVGGAPLPARTVWGGRLVMGRTIGRAQNGKPIDESGSSSV